MGAVWLIWLTEVGTALCAKRSRVLMVLGPCFFIVNKVIHLGLCLVGGCVVLWSAMSVPMLLCPSEWGLESR